MRLSHLLSASLGLVGARQRRGLGGVFLAAILSTGSAAEAAPVRVYAAGSLSGAMTALMAGSGVAPDAFAKPVFGPAGLLSERLQKGETADLFASADLAAPIRVAADHPGALVIPFVRNRMCVAAKPAVGLTEANMLDKMLAPDLRLATSTPGNDPGGDYALAVFKRADALRPGASKALADKALHLVGGPNTMVPIDGRSPSATIFLGDHADLFLYYCSSAASLLKEVPDLTNLPVPEALEVHPVYGLTVLSEDPATSRFALFVLSQAGQDVLSKFGFEPMTATR